VISAGCEDKTTYIVQGEPTEPSNAGATIPDKDPPSDENHSDSSGDSDPSCDDSERDQFDRLCSSYENVLGNNCLNARFNHQTGQYHDINTGAILQCNGGDIYDGYNSIPYQGMYGGQMINGCLDWTQFFFQFYGQYVQYIPVNLGREKRVCINVAYLQLYNPSQNWNQHYNNYVHDRTEMYVCVDQDCTDGLHEGHQYTCSTALSLGFLNGNLGENFGLCL
jgi:hypothetical protein